MNTIQKRFILFLFLCIGIRVLLVYVAKKLNSLNNLMYLKVMGILLIIPALGFFYIYATNSRTTGREVFGSKIWWNSLRPVHGFNYLLFGLMALSNNKKLYSNAWIPLLIDVCIGLLAFLIYHGKSNNFSKLIE
jgi:hypothetical protein